MRSSSSPLMILLLSAATVTQVTACTVTAPSAISQSADAPILQCKDEDLSASVTTTDPFTPGAVVHTTVEVTNISGRVCTAGGLPFLSVVKSSGSTWPIGAQPKDFKVSQTFRDLAPRATMTATSDLAVCSDASTNCIAGGSLRFTVEDSFGQGIPVEATGFPSGGEGIRIDAVKTRCTPFTF